MLCRMVQDGKRHVRKGGDSAHARARERHSTGQEASRLSVEGMVLELESELESRPTQAYETAWDAVRRVGSSGWRSGRGSGTDGYGYIGQAARADRQATGVFWRREDILPQQGNARKA